MRPDNNKTYKYQITVDGKTYDVSKDNIDKYGWDGYADDYPGATVRMRNDDGEDYDVPLGRVDAMTKAGLHPFKTSYTQPVQSSKAVISRQAGQAPNLDKTVQPWQPTMQQRLQMNATAQGTILAGKQTLDEADARMANIREYGSGLAPSSAVASDYRLNPKSGKIEKTYVTPTGERTFDRAAADAVSRAYHDAVDMTLSGQLRRAVKLRDDISRRLAERGRELQDEYDKKSVFQKMVASMQYAEGGYHDNALGTTKDDEYTKLMAALRQADLQVKELSRQQRREADKQGFWRTTGEILTDPYTYAHSARLGDMVAQASAKSGASEADDLLLEASYGNLQAQAKYGDNASFLERAGVMTGYMPSFMVDFMATGGGFSGINFITKATGKAATKALGKEVIKEMAKQGFKNYVKRNGLRGLGNEAANWTIKALGTTADDLLIRAPLMTNTVQAASTAADIIERKLGEVTVDDSGNYDFTNDKTWGSAIWQGEANSIVENYSEMFGAHLPDVASMKNLGKLANVIGAKRLGDVLAKADAGALGGITDGTRRIFQQMGVNDYLGEVSEEYYGQLWRTMLNLDDAYRQNPDGTRTNLFATGQFHGDIWGGMALSMGLMGAGKTTMSAANYLSMKHDVNKADARASELLTPEVWEPLRSTIDMATNDNVGDVAEVIVNDRDMTDEEKAAVMNYMERSLYLRGVNLAELVKSRGGEQDENAQRANDSYMDGYNAQSDVEMQDARSMYELQRQKAEQALPPEQLAVIDEDPMGALQNLGDDQATNQTIIDYINAKQVYDGMIQRVRDDIDGRIDQSNAMIDSRTNRTTGMIQGATMKVQDEEGNDCRVYVLDGNLAIYEDGTGIDHENSDGSIIIRDAESGKIEMVSPDAIFSVEQPVEPETEKQTAAEAIRQQFAQEAASRIDGVVPFNPGDTYTVTDESGQTAQMQIVPNADGLVDNGDGTVNVSSDGGQTVVPMRKEDIQAMVDATNRARVEQAEQKRETMKPQARPTYNLNDEITLLDENGNIVRGSITSDIDEDGQYEVYTETPINGWKVNLFTEEQLERMRADRRRYDEMLQTVDNQLKLGQQTATAVPQLVGRSLTEKESATLIAEMEAQAEAAPEMELTPANWQREFGADGMVDTPLGKVKMGENQITKLFAKGRDAQFGMIRPTLTDPDVIIEESSTSSDGTTERPSSYVFVKTFNRNGETIKFFASITVKKDGMEVSVSSHFMNKNAVARKMVDGNVMYIKEALRPISSEWHLAEHREDVPDLLPTQENNASITEDTTSTGKDTTPSGKKQGGVATSPIPRDSQGQPDYERADPDAAWDAIVEQTGGDEAMAQAVADSMMADKEAALKKAERAKPRCGVTIAEKIAAERGRKEAVERAKASLTHWQRIALTRQRRQMEAQAEQSRRAEEAARSRREQEERQRAELEEAERIRREALNGVPDIIDDTPQDARARGYRRVNGEKIDRQAPLALPGDVSADAVNRQFNDELQRQVDGTLPKGHIYRLGRPGGVLLSTGFPDLPIELSSTRLEEKSRQRNHEFDIADVRDLAKAINNPLAVFSYGNKDKAQNIVVEIERGGKKFVVGISLNPVVGGRNLEVNSIRGLFPKDNAEWLNWIAQGKLLYVDKQKIQALMSQQRTILADVGYLDLDAVANIVKNFENPDISIGNGAILGNEVQVKFDDKNIPTGHVALIEANQLQPSHLNGLRNPLHFIDEAQPKERNDEASVLSARRMAANIRPEEITSSVTAYTGAPTVNVRGEVIQGNNRSAALREMWAGEPAQAQKYKQYLTDHAADFGLTPEDVEAMRRPVLVSMVDVSDDEAITLGQFVAQDTESGGTERIKPRNVVQRMGGDMRSFASRLLSSSNDEMTFSELVDRNGMDVLKWMQQRGHISPTQYRSAFDNRGNLTAEAKNDLRGIMYQSIFQNGNTHLEEMFGTLPAKAQKAILATAYRDYDSPNAERMNAELQASISAYHALSQMPDFASAKNYREARLAAQTWQRQYAIDDVTGESYLPSDRYSNFAVLLAVMYKGQTQSFIQNTLDGIFDLVQGTQEATLFEQPDNTPRTLVKAINEAINARSNELLLNGKFIYDGQRRSNVLAGGSAASQQGRQGSAGDAPAGGRAEGGARTATDNRGTETRLDARQSGLPQSEAGGRRKAEEHPFPQENTQSGQKGQVSRPTIAPRLMTDSEKEQRGDMLRNAPAIDVEVGQIVSTPELSARKVAERWWDENVPEPVFYDTEVGEVEINRNSVESSLAHRYGQAKLDAITSLVEGFENAVYLGTLPDSRERGVVDHYFAYPINYKGKRNYVFCRAMQDANKNRLYVHEVFVADNIKKGDTLQTAASKPHGGIALYKDILANVLGETSEPTNSRTYVDSNLNGMSDDTATQHSSHVSIRKDTDKSRVTQTIGEKVAKTEEETEQREAELASRVQVNDDDWQDGDGERPTYKRSIIIDGTHTATQIDEPDENGHYTGSYVDYIDNGNTLASKIAQAEAETDQNPTEAQKEAGNYKKGHIRIGQFNITVENPKGSVRRGTDANGNPWETTMQNTYGYIRGTEGVDGDHIDVFLTNDIDGWNGRRVYVVDQYNEDGTFDEHKVMLGFNEEDEARDAYFSNYNNGWSDRHKIVMTSTNLEDFEKWIDSSHRKTKPFAEYRSVNAEQSKSISPADRIAEIDAQMADLKKQADEAHGRSDLFEEARIISESNELYAERRRLVQEMQPSAVQAEDENAGQTQRPSATDDRYTIERRYHKKNGSYIHAVKFTEQMPREQFLSLKKCVKDFGGYYSSYGKGGFIFETEEAGRKFAEAVLDPSGEKLDDEKPLSLDDMRSVEAGRQSWKYRVSVDGTGRTAVTRSTATRGVPVDDANFGMTADSPQAMLDILSNPQNGMGEVLDAVRTDLENAVMTQAMDTVQPVGHGAFGDIYDQFRGKPQEAIVFLSQKRGGEAVGALHHKDVGDIDLVWGNEGTGHSDGFGLAKLVKYHPEVLGNLQEVLNDMHVVSKSPNRVNLESDTHKAAVRLEWDGEKKTWLLTAFEKENSVRNNTTDTATTVTGKRNDTATPQNTVSGGKYKQSRADGQQPVMREVDVMSLFDALKRDGETKPGDHFVVRQAEAPIQEIEAPSQSGDTYGADNRLVSRARYEELKKRMRQKLGGQMNMGIDPEILAIGTEMAAYHIEAGARRFADYARHMIADLGDAIRPYLKSFYNGARDLPEVQEAGYAEEMTPYDEVRTFDTANFDKANIDAFATAEMVVAEQEVQKEAETAKEQLTNQRNKQRRKEDEQRTTDTEAVAGQAEAVASKAESDIETATDEKQVNETVEEIDSQLDKVNEQLALLGYYDADQVEGDFNEAYGYMRNAEKKAVKDANRLANRLVKDLGIDPKAIVDKKGKRRRSIAVANIAPIGGDISIYLPLGDKRELYINIQLDKQNGDNLKAKGGYVRIENPNPERGEERYLSSNNFFADDETYQSLLRKVQQLVKHYVTDFVPKSNTQQEVSAKAERKQGKRQRKQEEPKIADLFSAQEEYAVENQENSPFQKGDAVIYHGKPATVYDFGDDGRLVLDTGLAPVLYDIADPKEVKPANTASPNVENAEINRTFANAVKTDMLVALDSGTRPYRSILDLRKRAASLGMEVDNDGRTDILLQELVEDGLVRAAREVVEQHGRDSRESYDLICKLYDMQPTIAARSSNRIKMQQYSTPLPMAWNAAHFAMSGKKEGKVLEPTAGNGMLVFSVPAQQVHANELDETRLDNLREQGFAQVTRQDAAEPFEGGQQYDVIIANPPFGKREEVEYDGKMIPGLDPQITLNALASMKDDGKAAIIIGGNMEYGNNGGLKSMKPFFTYLYDHYNVKGVVDMDGRLYAKQGTTYPTRMILIAGRRSDEERAQTAVYPPVESKAIRKAESFDDLYEIVNEVINSKEKTNGTEILRSQQGQLVSVADRPSRNTDGKRHTGQSRTDDTSGRGRRASVEGTQEQSEVVLRGEHRTDTGDGETRRGTGGNTTGGSRGVPEPDVQRVDRVGVSTNRVGLSPEPKKRNLTEEKLPYRPHNSAFSLESVAPAAMVEAMDNVLSQIEAENGNIDEFVKKELGYDTIEETHQALAAEQIDSVAMAIYQMKKGQALIIGDQTGVGKGRQMAALIRWAVKRGEKPIFITQKADLFSDIYRDLVDIGSGDLVPFIFNSPSAKENKGEMVDANGKVVYKGLSDAKMKKVMATGKLPDEYDYAVLTYSQVNSGDEISQKEAEEAAKKRGGRTKKSKASKDGKATPKATFLRAIAEDNYLFLDESHTAAGTSNTGAYLQSILRSAKAATFASATFAKRPDTMPLYAIRTAMSQAKVEPDKLIGIIEKGGVTLQEIMSRELTNAGQMVRRERDMSDVVTDWKTITDPVTVKRSRENYDRTIAAFNAIIKFQEDYVKPMVDAMDKELAVMAESAGIKRGTDKLGISNVPFASKTYNYTKQLMLALKVDAIVNEVDTEIKAGRHPVIALESTMESSIKDYSAGEVIEEPTFSASLLRGLDTVMQYTIKDENGKEQHARYSPKQLGEAGEKAYYELQDFIRKSTSDIFISPLDAIIERLHGIGYKVGELTGRDMYVERDDEGRVVVKRRTDKDKKKMQREFNNGTLDVLILNKSASTGISLHASEKFSDQRQRTMIIAQPLSDINDYMQMIGRIDRTGQVHRGYYINLGLPVPAENRFLMMLSTKLKSLNANTTTSQDSESNDVEAPDLLNKYGSQVVVEYLRDNPEIYEKMGSPLKKSGEGSNTVSIAELEEYKPQEDDARKITGYVALLTTKEQEEFYDDVVRRYNELIKYLNDTGSNDLKITVMPLRAKTLSKRVSSEGIDPTGTNPFARNSYVERVEMDVLRKPMKAAEIRKTIAQVNKGKRPEDYIRQVIATIEKEDEARVAAEEARYERSKVKAQEDIAKQTDKINRQQKRTAEEKQAAIADYVRETNDNVESKHNDNMVRINTNSDMLKQRLHMFEVGKSYLMPDNLESMVFDFSTPAIFCGYKSKDSKITASTTLAVFATLDGRRRMEVKLSQPEALRNIYKATNDNWDAARSTTLENWDSQIPTGTRKTGFIMTGNILQAIADTQDEHGGYPGQLISYTDIDGNVHDGILMPDKWNTSMLKTSGTPIISRLKQIKDYMPVTSHDGKVDITGSSWAKVYYLTVPKTKKDGAVYYENKTLLDAVHGHNFYPYRGKLRADITAENIERVVRELSKLGVRVKEETNEDDALYRLDDELAEVNERFNEQLDGLTEENADSVTLSLGRPSAVLRAAGVEDKPMKLYGNKVMKKMRKHGFTLPELRDLPRAVADPIAVFKNYGKEGNRSILTELRTEQGNFLVTLTLGEGHDVDFNIVTSVFGKGGSNIVDWINKGFATYINKEKALDYLHHSALKAVTSDSQELISAANVVRNFENPGINGEETYRDVYRLDDDELGEVNERFNEELRRYDSGEMDTNEMFHLGMPQGVMRAFLPDLPIVMRQRVAKKGAEKKHNVPTSALQDMPSMISDPIFVFQRDANTIGILTDMTDNDGKNVCVAIELGRVIQNGGEYLEVNDIRSFHGREVKYIIEPIAHNNTLRYANKEKGLAWLSSASQPVQQEIDKQDLIDAANIVRNFENPSFNGDNLREGVGELSDDDLSIANDPVSKLLGKSTRTAAQRRAFAERERLRMVDAVQDLAAKLHLDNVEVVTDASTLDGRRAKAKGFYSRSTGRITIVIPNHTSVYDAEQTLLHEAVAHYGLRELFGEHFDTFLDNVFQSADSDVRRRITELARERNWDFRTATEEYLASLAEETNFEAATRSGWWQKIKDAFMRMLHSIGFENFSGVTLSDNELRYILWRSYENLAEPGRYRSILGEAEDVVMQSRLKVGNYAEAAETMTSAAEPAPAQDDGDKVARIEKLRRSEPVVVSGNDYQGKYELNNKSANKYILDNLRGEYINKDTGDRINLTRKGANKSMHHDAENEAHLKSAAYIPQIIENAIFIDEEANTKDKTGFDSYRYYVVGLNMGGVDYTVRLTVGVKDGQIYYDHALTEIEKNSLLDGIDLLKRKFADKEAARMADYSDIKDKRLLSILQTNSAKTDDSDTLFREGDPEVHERTLARDRYEQRVKRGVYQTQEALQDSMLGLREAMEAILKGEGKKKVRIEDVDGFENAYLGENRLSSVNKAEADAFAHTLFKPLLDEVGKLAPTKKAREELTDYMMAKHGLERNRVMRQREKDKLIDASELSKNKPQPPTENDDDYDLKMDAYNKAVEDWNNQVEAELGDKFEAIDQRDFAGLTALTDTDNVADAEAEARQMVEDYESGHDTDTLWKRTNAVSDATLSKLYESGMMSKATYDNIRSMYDYFIPLRGFDEKTSEEAYAYLNSKNSAFNAPIKTAKGRKSKADDPFAYLQSMAESAIVQGNRNKLVKQKFLNFVLNHPSDLASVSDIWLKYDKVADEWQPVFPDNINADDTPSEVERKLQDFEDKMKELAEQDPDLYKHGKDTVNIPYRVVEKRDLRQHQVVVKRGGRDYVITINGNPRAAQALNGQTNPDNDMSGAVGAILKAGERINRELSALYTTRNPDFVVSNFIRDMLYSNSMVWIKESPNYAMRFHRNFAKVNPVRMKMLLAKYRKNELDMSIDTERMFHQFMMNGGETGYSNMRDIEKHKNDIRREIRKAGGQLPIRKAWDWLAERLDEVNRGVENCARFAAFMTSREMGRTIDRSIYDAKEISVNFNKKGSGAKFMGATGQTKLGNSSAFMSGLGRSGFVFWNAAIQGTANFGRQAKRHPAKALTSVAVMFLLGAIVASLGYGDDDEDDKNSYWNLPEYVRRSNLLFRAGDQWISIPLPVEYRAVYGLGELMVSTLSGKEHFTDGELASKIAGQVSQLLPLDFMEGGGGFKAFIPSSIKPFAEAYGYKKSWTGLPIYKDTPYNKDMPEWTKAYKSANKYLVDLSETLNEMSGGDQYTKGAIDINPAKVEYVLNGYFGGIANTIDKLTKMGETMIGQREYDPKSFLVLNRILKNGDERTEYKAVNNEYFRLKEEHDKLRTRLRNYERDTENGVFDYAEKIDFLYNSPEYARYEIFENYRPDIDDLYDMLNDAYTYGDKEAVKDIETQLNELKKMMISDMNKARK